MRRREFVAGVCCAAVFPASARGQQSERVRLIGFLSGLSRPNSIQSSTIGGFPEGMRELGYVEGKDFAIEWRFAEGKYERFREFATELVRRNVDVFVLGTPVAVHPVAAVTSKIPVVMGFSTDPVGNGFVTSLSRPGGNITGLATSQDDAAPKLIELATTAVPNLSRLGVLNNPASPNVPPMIRNIEAAAKAIGLTIVPVGANSLEGIEKAFSVLSSEQVGVFVLISDSLFNTHRKRIGELAIAGRIASIFAQREYVQAGGLLSYGENYRDLFKRAAYYVDRIFKGANPSDLPIEQPTRFYLTINLKTAKALGLTMPASLLARADEVIE